jgi:rhodanese-related sulfurtransferase
MYRPLRSSRRRTVVLVAALALALPLAACSGDAGSADAEPEAATTSVAAAALADGRTPIDVRTPEEHDAGHVADDVLIDIQAADFDDRIAELDPDGEYVVYCRSGNRSAQAAARMEALGLDVVDGGAFTDMTAAGWPAA